MKQKQKFASRILSLVLCLAVFLTALPMSFLSATEASGAVVPNDDIVTDAGSAYTWETMLGQTADGTRYAGRIWVDKSVYKAGDTVLLDNKNQAGSQFTVDLEEDEKFQLIFSALGSSVTTTTTTRSSGPIDVVLVLDGSASMYEVVNGESRLKRTIDAANGLLDQILELSNVRLSIVTYHENSEVILPLARYEKGTQLRVLNNNYSFSAYGSNAGGIIYAVDKNGREIGQRNSGYKMITNLQGGIDTGFAQLANASEKEGRQPVAIVLTDGAANYASLNNWQNPGTTNLYNGGDAATPIVLGTILNAAYNKARVEKLYGKSPVVYSVSVDMSSSGEEHAIVNPGSASNGFSASNSNSNIRNAYNYYTQWVNGNSAVSFSARAGSGYNVGNTNRTWTFNQLTSGSPVSKAELIANINYVDNAYTVSSVDLGETFKEIINELKSSAFNPLDKSETVQGGTSAETADFPVRYVDYIGDYMEIKEIQAIALFGQSFTVAKGATTESNGSKYTVYTVNAGTGTNPTTGEEWNTAEHIKIQLVEDANRKQTLYVEIARDILPIILDTVKDETVAGSQNATLVETIHNPLRLYYTVGIDADILLPNGEIDAREIKSGDLNSDGTLTLYSNRFSGESSSHEGSSATRGDAHVGLNPSKDNRYYYHQTAYEIFSEAKMANGSAISWENGMYGVLYEEGKYALTLMSYAEYQQMDDDDQAYVYVTFYRPTASTADAATAAEKVTYLVYNEWKYLKESVAFYNKATNTYVNDGAVMTAAEIAAYVAANPGVEANLVAVLGEDSHRTSRFHNMTFAKETNVTGTATLRYDPEYNANTGDHEGRDVIVYLGNNGKITAKIDTGIALTKEVTEPIGNADDTYALTVTGANATIDWSKVMVRDADGKNVTATISSYSGNVLTVNVKAGETVWVSGIPAGTECTVSEAIPAGSEYHMVDGAQTVTIPAAAAGVEQYARVTVTNAPYKFGNLTIAKDVTTQVDNAPDLTGKVFAFTVKVGSINGEFAVDAVNYDQFQFSSIDQTTGKITFTNGEAIIFLKDAQSITILNLPEGEAYEVTEAATDGFAADATTKTGTIVANDDQVAHFVNTYTPNAAEPIDIIVTGTKTLRDDSVNYAGNEDFQFVVERFDSATQTFVPITNQSGTEIGKDTAHATESYSITLTDVVLPLGVHLYRVREIPGTTSGMSYDISEGHFSIEVKDENLDGVFEYRAGQPGGSTAVTVTIANDATNGRQVTVIKNFNNVYELHPTHVDVKITKNLVNNTGVEIPKNNFMFRLVDVNTSIVKPISANANGEATIRISKSTPGRYVYTLQEVQGGMVGMDYDETTYTLTIDVVSNNNNTPDNTADDYLEASWTLQKNNETTTTQGTTANTVAVEFNNTYTLTPVTNFTIEGTKEIQIVGRNGFVNPNADDFTFELYETDASFVLTNGQAPEVTVNNDEYGKFVFNLGSFNTVGTHYYSIKEAHGTLAGVTYDHTHYHVTVTVGIDPNDETRLKATTSINKVGHNSDTSGNIVFVNEYRLAESDPFVIDGTKTLTGRAARAGEFLFELYKAGETTPFMTTANKVDGTFAFEGIVYDAFSDIGIHEYVVKEKHAGETINGVTYDSTAYTIYVKVTDGNGKLTAVQCDSNGNALSAAVVPTFTNTYDPADATVTFTGEKELKGETLAAGDFTFALYQTDRTFGVSGRTALDTVTNGADGSFAFDSIGFATTAQAGTYFYAIVEDASNPEEGIVYDKTVHKFVVQISDVGDGKLYVTVYDVNAGTVVSGQNATSHTESVKFTNAADEEVTEKTVYYQADPTINIDGKKVQKGEILTYFITYENFTGADAEVLITDIVPEYTSYVENSASAGGVYTGEHLSWDLFVARGEAVTVSFQVKVEVEEVIVANTAHVFDGTNQYSTNEVFNHTVDDPSTKKVAYADDPAVEIDGKKVYAGEELLYTIRFVNVSGETTDVKITDKLSQYLTYEEDSASDGGVYADGTLTWNFEDVAAWETVTVTFKAKVKEDVGAASIPNKATIKADDNYVTNEVKVHTVEDKVEKEAFLAGDTVTNIDGKKVKVGDELLYTISYENTDTQAASVVITDTVPAGTTYVDGSADKGGVHADGTITWNLEVEGGRTVTVSFKVKVNEDAAGKTLTNTAKINEGKNEYTTNSVTNEVEVPTPPAPTPDPDPDPTPTPDPDPVPQPTPDNNDPPQTGGSAHASLWLAALVLSGGGILVTLLSGRKKEEVEQ